MSLRFWQVDAFTDRPFRGNPAAVCILEAPADEAWMQDVAREMNLSETAFLHPEGDFYRLRWFTPAAEVDLCGHATLASAHILWSHKHLPPGREARFLTRSGELRARLDPDGWIELDFPRTPDEPAQSPEGLAEALGADPVYLGRSPFDYLVELESETTVRDLSPNMSGLKSFPVRGIIVTARAETPGLDFVSRFFAPRVGVDEDPVTGSSHSCLGPYWSRRLGRPEMRAYQASARGGHLKIRVGGERVYIGGQAVTVIQGDLL
ncbi:MAG: PhzF family phenazine biosynthesis protein [Proteobacteria bacterium]|nr:PhzF family phenazine biosynthesis protein [Pseudomonadota bacterium]